MFAPISEGNESQSQSTLSSLIFNPQPTEIECVVPKQTTMTVDIESLRSNFRIKPEHKKACTRCGVCCASIGFAVYILIILPLSFSYVDYYEYGLKQRKSTGKVNTDRVYTRGRYHLGPDNTILSYPADAQILNLNNVDIFSNAGTNSVGLSFSIDVTLIYFLKPNEIGSLHQDLAKTYQSILQARTNDAIKNSAISITFNDYFERRKEIENQFRQAVQKRWNDAPALHIALDQFYLGRIRIPETVAQKQLEARIQNERNDMEMSLQEARLEREKTAVDVNKVNLEIDLLISTTKAEAKRDTANANALAEQIMATALNNGTLVLLDAVGITTQDQSIAYTYIRNLQNRQGLDLRVSYLSDDNVVKTTALLE